MRQLLLLRHAKSSWEDPALADHDRPLDAEGLVAARALGAAAERLAIRPQLILVSSARRTRETVDCMTPLPNDPPVLRLPALYLASPGQVLEQLADVAADVGSVLVVAHNPGLHDLAVMLAGAHGMSLAGADGRRLARGFPTAALAEFAVAGAWRSLPQGARLVRFLTPHDVQQAAG